LEKKKKKSNYHKTSCFEEIKFITEDTKVKHTNITTKLKLKLFTKVIRAPSNWLGFLQTESLIKREAQVKVKSGAENVL